MEIVDVTTTEFTYTSRTTYDEFGHTHPSEPHEDTKTLTTVVVDGGPDGYFFGGTRSGAEFAASKIVGENPLEREVIWRRLRQSQRLGKETISNLELAAIDCALWDVAGRHLGEPIYALLGGPGGEIPACAYTMNGDDDPDGLGSPAAYADFARTLVDQGYDAIDLHGWMPPYDVDVDRDVAACTAVREAVGEDVDLMLTPYHHHDRTRALALGNGLENLDFRWLEEPMDEYSLSSYEWLTDALDVTVMGAKSIDGNLRARAEWIKRGISDAIRIHVDRIGGLTPAVKTGALCEAFGVQCEVSGSSAPCLQLLGSTTVPGEYYQRGTLHPDSDYDIATPWFERPIDPLTDRGTVPVPDRAGLGYHIDWTYITENER